MDQTNKPADAPAPDGSIDAGQLEKIKANILANAKAVAQMGVKTVKADQDPANTATTDWWEFEQSFDNDFWSVSLWVYPSDKWQIQITKVAIQTNGSSLMISYGIRMDDDKQFPGFQIYQESVDESYRPMKLEEIVLLDRVLQGLLTTPHTPKPATA
jgi:hypothetical protein